jgi:outer membrane lipoprotein-sorting protein
MKTTTLTPKALFFLFAYLFTAQLAAQDASAILNKLDDVVYSSEDQASKVTLVLSDRNNNERTREAEVWQKGTDKRLFRFTAPAAEAGIAFLSLPDDVMYLYMPAFGRERRIASHVKNQSFAGTDFSYEDLESTRYAEKYEPVLIEETSEYFILELTPLPDVRSDYSKVIAYVNKDHYYPEKMESYDRGGQKTKIADYTFEKKDDYWYIKEIYMQDLKRDHSTRMTFTGVVFDTGLDEGIFTVRNLTRY